MEGYRLSWLTDSDARKPHDFREPMLLTIISRLGYCSDDALTENNLLALVNDLGAVMMDNDMLSEQAGSNMKAQFGANSDYKDVMMDSVANSVESRRKQQNRQ